MLLGPNSNFYVRKIDKVMIYNQKNEIKNLKHKNIKQFLFQYW